MAEKDYIGFDPIKWVERLINVGDASLFKDDEKEVISRHLNAMWRELEKLKDDRSNN